MKKYLASVLALVILGSTAHGAAPAQSSDMSREYRYLMGTSVEVRAVGKDQASRAAAIQEAFAAMAEVDRVMSNWRADSEITAVNRDAADFAVHVSDALFSVIDAGQSVSDRSGGAFDLTVGPLVRLWGFRPRQPRLPSRDELASVRGLVNYRNIQLDQASRTVRFVRPGVEIDLGGIAKGFAVELAAGVLRRRGLDGFIDAGGNQYMLGRPVGKTMWTVGVRDPDRADGLLGTLDLPEGSVSTSAQYANVFTVDGRKFGHIFDPRTLMPSDVALAVTLYSPDGTLADAASKAVFNLGPVRGLALIDSYPQMLGVVAYRKPDGAVALSMTTRTRAVFHPIGARS
jgi:thiamine biosynthesis lipoprotein